MKRYANLMSDRAMFRAAARKQLRRWAVVLAVLAAVLTPLAGIRWREQTRVRQKHEALEAAYAPVKRLSELNRQLRAEAIALVDNERLALELSRERTALSILARVSEAAEKADGDVYIQRLTCALDAPGAKGKEAERRLTLEAAATLTYDISQFVEALKHAPVKTVKITSDHVTVENGVDRKDYALDCEL